MASAGEGLLCGVCHELMREPHSLPCGHTFCRQPCLLSQAGAETVRCIYCKEEFDAKKMRPNKYAELRTHLHSSQQEQEQTQKQPVGKGRASCEGNLTDQCCSACKGQIQPDLLVHCHHCQRQICMQCLDKHWKSYKLELRMNLHFLSCQKASLRMRPERLNGMVKNSRGGIAGAVEEAVSELHTVASKALYAAIAKVKAVDLESTQTIDELVHRITELSIEVGKVHDVSNLLKGTQTLQKAVTKWQHLKSLLNKAAELNMMIKNLPPPPLTQMRLSDRVSEINQQLKDCSLVVLDELVSLPQSP